LEPALALAALTQARCDLLRVVESHPAAAGADDPPEVAVARDYLARVAAMVSERGLPAGWRVAVAPSAAAAIIAEAEANDHDLVAMSAEGHSRLGRLVLGSTPEKVILGVRAAVLAYRPASRA
jgi:nucleotide-binding universal stress UspA family protein